MSTLLRIKPAIKDYDWGNDSFIASLMGLEKNGPRAELWMGAHRQGSAVVEETGQKLCDYLDENPSFAGSDADSFPYLFKILAIDRSLSIQCHPDSRQAKAGYEAEAGVRRTRDRKDWNYQDPNPKAEMLYALTPVKAMCGFRKLEDSMKLLESTVPVFLQDHISKIGTIFELFDSIYRMPLETLEFGQAELIRNSDNLPEPERSVIRQLCDRNFGDPGVFCPLLLNIVSLEPGQAVYLKPRVLHAYISGNGVELMNNSDNVLRAGLTHKHMDLDELERVMLHETYIPTCMPSAADEGGTHFVCEGGFTLTVMQNGTFRSTAAGARILLCTQGTAVLDGHFSLSKGQCCIAGTDQTELSVDARNATVFMAE